MTKQQQEAHIRTACRRAGCDSDTAELHRNRYIKHGWDSHPPQDFATWFLPTGIDDASGASVGGQPDAERTWARPDSGGWSLRTYGMTVEVAFNTAQFRETYLAWADAGRPEYDEPFVSLALPLDEQAKRMTAIKTVLREVGRVPADVEEIPF